MESVAEQFRSVEVRLNIDRETTEREFFPIRTVHRHHSSPSRRNPDKKQEISQYILMQQPISDVIRPPFHPFIMHKNDLPSTARKQFNGLWQV
jgi:hypothetical protein